MSKNVSIQEGGTAKQLTANKLKTNLVGGGTALWVPEDETQLTTKYISENGTYNASDDGYYGYSSVTVSGIGSVTGYDSSGNEAYVTTDDTTGEIVTTVMPSSIEVTTLPNYYGIPHINYINGETIDYEGMEVTAYDKNGEVWTDTSHPEGILTPSDLILTVTTAHRSDQQESTSDLINFSVSSVPRLYLESRYTGTGIYDGRTILVKWEIYAKSGGAVEMCISFSGVRSFSYVIGAANIGVGVELPFVTKSTKYDADTGEQIEEPVIQEHGGNFSYSHNGQKVYYSSGWVSGALLSEIDRSSLNVTPVDYEDFRFADEKKIAWTMLYGEHSGEGSGIQTIPVQWERPGDHEKLETSFEIHVAR